MFERSVGLSCQHNLEPASYELQSAPSMLIDPPDNQTNNVTANTNGMYTHVAGLLTSQVDN